VAAFEEIIARQSQGYNTKLHPDRHSLSSSERLQLGLARAVYGEPSAFIFDSDFRKLDAQALAIVKDRLRAEVFGRTVVTTSLTFSAIRPIDWVYVLHGGEIVKRGPPDLLRNVADTLPT
jgi:ABC-type protease/lipase transport system fused ATPase/permease subunit